jgi:uncharacterized protein DUF4386
MTTAVSPRIRETSPRCMGKLAGVFFLLSVTSAITGEFFAQGGWNVGLGLVAVVCYVVVTLLLYGIFKVVNRGLARLALTCNFAALALEAVRWNPAGVDVAMVFHGLFCLLTGYLVFRSMFLPRILAALMWFAGLDWLTYVRPALANSLSPYNLVGLVGEGALYLWLLVAGLNLEAWQQRAVAEWRTH